MHLFLKNNKRKILLYLIDMGFFTLVYVLSYFATQFATNSTNLWANAPRFALSYAVFFLCLTVSKSIFRVYSNVWRYANGMAYIEMVLADMTGGVAALTATVLMGTSAFVGAWRSAAVVAGACLLSLFSRFLYQERHKRKSALDSRSAEHKKGVAIIGAGMAGALLADELLYSKGSLFNPLFFIDTDERKAGSKVAGLPVYMQGEETLSRIAALNVEELIITIPGLDLSSVQRIFEYYAPSGCKIKIYDFPNRDDSVGSDTKREIREIKIEDLLCRDTVKLIDEKTKDFYKNKSVLVTGGGGSIGSELCRQIAKCAPKRLIIFDVYENNAYDIQQELCRKYGNSLDLAVEIGSVRDRQRLESLFALYKPQVVFHAAAHKHVPLMERSNGEAIKNNVFGTRNTADMAEKYGTEKFILISTDKAVNPTNVMGASKRLCEMVIKCRTDSATSFCAVRFGNVLGSNGSVIPLFKRQIAAGGPVTVTDKRIVRYFMTIPEASGLVMQAGAMAKRGELFVLDMGKPVKILDLAVNMIRFSGLEPYRDIAIKEIGLRPGEKLYEELLVDKDRMDKTENDLIFIEKEDAPSRKEVEDKLSFLEKTLEECSMTPGSPKITDALREVVPTFRRPEEINDTAEQAEEMRNTANAE